MRPRTLLAAAVVALASAAAQAEPLAVEIGPICLNVPNPLAQELTNTLGGKPWAVRSLDWWRVWFVSAPLPDGSVATWATDSLRGEGNIWSIDERALGVSSWPVAPALSLETHGATTSRECVR